MPQAAMVIGAVAGVAGTVVQYTQGRKIARAQQKQQQVATRKERLQALRATMIQGAQGLASATGAGSADSSGAIGGLGSLRSQLGTEMGFSTQMSAISSQISAAAQRSAFGEALGGLGWTAFQWGNNAKVNKAPIPTPNQSQVVNQTMRLLPIYQG